MPYRTTKRAFDLAAAIVLFPLILVVAGFFGLLFWLTTGEKPVFRQQRTGLHGRPFRILKLRSMTSDRDADGKLLPDEQRITALGAFLRKTSLDELPQIVNILRGELSFVGPRPQAHDFLGTMTAQERRRHDVIPGVTGWAQINGRNGISWEKRFALDLWYVDNASFWLDLRILLLTPWVVFGAKGVSHEGCATMPNLLDLRFRRVEDDLP